MNVREARNINYRLQVRLIELLSGKKMSINLPDKANPVLLDLDCRQENVSDSIECILF